jgi:parallel beta-helix repeat protein
MKSCVLAFATLITMAALPATEAMSATRYVANNGVDSGACGSSTDPCRSITQAITNAGAGDTVSVGPGLYGDVDGDGVLGEAGEEPVTTCGTFDCLVHVSKQVVLISQLGAFSTVIDPGPLGPETTVTMGASSAVLGGKGRGFTIYNRDSGGYAIRVNPGIGDLLIAGNVLNANSGLFNTLMTGSGGDVISGNRVLCTGTGGVGLISQPANSTLTGNTVSGCYYGASLFGTGAVLTSNVFHGNQIGLDALGTPNFTISKCSFIGNPQGGIYAGGASSGTITSSNFVGTTAVGNCGLDANLTNISATDCWWGSASGPGAEPADNACDTAGATTPFATAPVKVKPKPVR